MIGVVDGLYVVLLEFIISPYLVGWGERDLIIVVLLCVSLTSNEIRHLFLCFSAV